MTKDQQEGQVLEARPATPNDFEPATRLRGWRASNRALQRRPQPQITLPPIKWLDEGEPDA
jgi:hypothetical protein